MPNNLPNIRVDSVLAQLPGLDEGDEVKCNLVIKALWAYIRAKDLKV